METSQIGLIITHAIYVAMLIGLLLFAHRTLKALCSINQSIENKTAPAALTRLQKGSHNQQKNL